jgi:hypothetical protein
MNSPEDNLFLFAIPGHATHMRGDAVLRRFALEFESLSISPEVD